VTGRYEPRRGARVRLLSSVVAGVLGVGAVAAAVATRPQWDTAHYQWKVTKGDQRDAHMTLSIVAKSSDFGDGTSRYTPTLSITCEGGRPNVAITPIVTGYCGVDGACKDGATEVFSETFLNKPDSEASIADTRRAATARYNQDTLSNPPDKLVGATHDPDGVSQKGAWTSARGSASGKRFAYGANFFDPNADADADLQARNFIRRLAASKTFELKADSHARFDTRDLAPRLKAFWAQCPVPPPSP
jgi:hypothetical protein